MPQKPSRMVSTVTKSTEPLLSMPNMKNEMSRHSKVCSMSTISCVKTWDSRISPAVIPIWTTKFSLIEAKLFIVKNGTCDKGAVPDAFVNLRNHGGAGDAGAEEEDDGENHPRRHEHGVAR
jgi:hypothetical protein